MFDLHFKFEEDRTKTMVAVDSDSPSDGQTLKWFCICPMLWIALDRQ